MNATQTAEARRQSRRLGGPEPTRSAPQRDDAMPRELPKWAIKMRWDYEAQLKKLNDRINELENAALMTEKARRTERANDKALELYGESQAVKDLTKRLDYLLPNAQEIGQRGVALVSQIAIAHGLDPLPGSDHVYAWTNGGKLLVTIGYKGLLHLARKQVQFTHESRPMTPEERAEHGLTDVELGYITTIYEIDKAIKCKQAGIPYFPIVGTAVQRPKDRTPAGRSAAWVAQKNSLKDALRQITSTGVRMEEALDQAFKQVQGAEWVMDLEDGDERDSDDIERELIDAGYIKPDQDIDAIDAIEGTFTERETATAEAPQQSSLFDASDNEPEMCPDCGQHPVSSKNPFGTCEACARALADAEAAKS